MKNYDCSAGPSWANTGIVIAAAAAGMPYIPPTKCTLGNLYVVTCFITRLVNYVPPCPWREMPGEYGDNASPAPPPFRPVP